MVIRDFNANVGKGCMLSGAACQYRRGEINEKKEQLVIFSLEKDLYISNIVFNHHARCHYT